VTIKNYEKGKKCEKNMDANAIGVFWTKVRMQKSFVITIPNHKSLQVFI
jgi:hypothetical protein